MRYENHELTTHPVRGDGYYWIRLSDLPPIVGRYTCSKHPGTGLWLGFWRLPGHSITYADTDFSFIDGCRLEVPSALASGRSAE